MNRDMTPREIVAELDRYIIGQHEAKRAVAIAMRNRYRRRLLDDALRDEVVPKNILMIGPTGVGKTEIARRLATLARAPFVKVEATKYTEVGYVGRDVESMVRDLAEAAIRMVREERSAEVRQIADDAAVERIVDVLHPETAPPKPSNPNNFGNLGNLGALFGMMQQQTPQSTARGASMNPEHAALRDRAAQEIREGFYNVRLIDVEVEEMPNLPLGVLGGPEGGMPGMPGMPGGADFGEMLGGMLPKRRVSKRMTVNDARRVFAAEEEAKLIDQEALKGEAVRRASEDGIIFIDEFDKIAGRESGRGPDVSREGVQRDILPIVEGSTVTTKYGTVKTDHVLFIAAGAFHMSKPSDLIPELQGRFPIRVELDSLTADDLRTILTEPQNSLTRQYTALLETEGVMLDFTDDGIAEIARYAAEVNERAENIGARRLHTVLERLLETVSFEAPEKRDPVRIDEAFVRDRLSEIVKSADLSTFIL